MKTGTRFLIGLVAAGLTFGTLVAVTGKPHMDRFGHHACYEQNHHKHDAKQDSLRAK